MSPVEISEGASRWRRERTRLGHFRRAEPSLKHGRANKTNWHVTQKSIFLQAELLETSEPPWEIMKTPSLDVCVSKAWWEIQYKVIYKGGGRGLNKVIFRSPCQIWHLLLHVLLKVSERMAWRSWQDALEDRGLAPSNVFLLPATMRFGPNLLNA